MHPQVLDTICDEKQTTLRHLTYQTTRPDTDTTTEETITLDEYSSVVNEGLRQLSAQRRLVFRLRSEQGFTNEQVADQLQVSIGTVKDQYYHACRFLRDYLRQHAGVKAMLVVMTTFCN